MKRLIADEQLKLFNSHFKSLKGFLKEFQENEVMEKLNKIVIKHASDEDILQYIDKHLTTNKTNNINTIVKLTNNLYKMFSLTHKWETIMLDLYKTLDVEQELDNNISNSLLKLWKEKYYQDFITNNIQKIQEVYVEKFNKKINSNKVVNDFFDFSSYCDKIIEKTPKTCIILGILKEFKANLQSEEFIKQCYEKLKYQKEYMKLSDNEIQLLCQNNNDVLNITKLLNKKNIIDNILSTKEIIRINYSDEEFYKDCLDYIINHNYGEQLANAYNEEFKNIEWSKFFDKNSEIISINHLKDMKVGDTKQFLVSVRSGKRRRKGVFVIINQYYECEENENHINLINNIAKKHPELYNKEKESDIKLERYYGALEEGTSEIKTEFEQEAPLKMSTGYIFEDDNGNHFAMIDGRALLYYNLNDVVNILKKEKSFNGQSFSTICLLDEAKTPQEATRLAKREI